MEKFLVSIIIPVYKVEEYLDECINSICAQTYKNLELILVDDGSPDCSGTICDSWAKKDNRIVVIHQNNHGGGYARNIALNKAKGEFIAFVDSDDCIAPRMIEHLVKYLIKYENIDIVECDFISFSENSCKFVETENKINIKKFSTIDALHENILDHYFRQLIWNKLYRKKVIADIRFPEEKIDDEFWTYRVLGNAKNLIHLDCNLYAYRQHPNSVMHSMGIQKRIQGLEAKCERHEYIKEKYPELEQESLISIWNAAIYHGQLVMQSSKKDEQKTIFQYLDSVLNKYPMKIVNSKKIDNKQKIWYLMSKLSLKITSRLRNKLKIGM